MTRRQRTWLGLTGGWSVLAMLTWLCWLLISSGATQPLYAATRDADREIAQLDSPPYVRLETMFNDGQDRPRNQPGGLFISHSVRQVKEGREIELTFAIRNDSDVVANAGFFFTRRPLRIHALKHHRVQATATVDASDQRASVGLGFHLFREVGGYVGEYVPPSGRAAWKLPGEQALEADYVGTASGLFNGKPAGLLSPRISIVNIEPRATVQARVLLRAPEVFGEPNEVAQVLALQTPVVTAQPGGVLRTKLRGHGVALDGDALLDQVLVLRSAAGESHTFRRGAASWRARGRVEDLWEQALPQNLKPGRYAIYFGLLPQHSKDAFFALKGGAGARGDASGLVRVGELAVAPGQGGMRVGMTFHRYPGRSEGEFGPIKIDYHFARSLGTGGMSGMQWWASEDRFDWTKVDAWAAYHAKGDRKLLVVFSGSPTWASARPKEPSAMMIPGYAAPPAKKYWPSYRRLVEQTVKRLKGRLLAVECWNEPDLVGGFTGTATELADLCKIVSTTAKQVDASLPVICPQPESPHGMAFVFGARTSEGEKITDFCDYVGAHVYNAMGDDPEGRPYDEARVEAVVARMRDMMQRFGVDKPLAVTEYGIAGCDGEPASGHQPFIRMSSEEAGVALYQSIKAFRQAEVQLLGLYSYDHEIRNERCRPGGSFIRTTKTDMFGVQVPDLAVQNRITQAVRDFAK